VLVDAGFTFQPAATKCHSQSQYLELLNFMLQILPSIQSLRDLVLQIEQIGPALLLPWRRLICKPVPH
jgi:hypothetical protein